MNESSSEIERQTAITRRWRTLQETTASLTCRYAFLGDTMRLAERVRVTWDTSTGKLVDIEELPGGTPVDDLLLVPCFLNGHVHVGDSFLKDAGFHTTLQELVAPPNGFKHQMLAKTSRDHILDGILLSIEEMYSNGISGFLDFREGSTEGYSIIKDGLARANHPFHGRALVRPLHDTSDIENLCRLSRSEPAIAGFNISSPNDWDDAFLENMAAAVNDIRSTKNFLMATHVAETESNPRKSFTVHGASDTRRITRIFNGMKHDLVLVHCNFLQPEDLECIARSGAHVVFCPRVATLYGNLNKGTGYYRRVLESGIPCSLGTDNVMLNSPDMFQEMNFFTRLLKMQSPTWKFDISTVLQMATINPARMMGLGDATGSLSKGKDASFFTIDLSRPTMASSNDIGCSLLLRAHPGLIKALVIQGVNLK